MCAFNPSTRGRHISEFGASLVSAQNWRHLPTGCAEVRTAGLVCMFAAGLWPVFIFLLDSSLNLGIPHSTFFFFYEL